ncbi:hypothetical protein GCM10010191_31540 [Actinomadura vinacea]|uniref:DUF58 domain-containing protein n=1 Tax=Actinomadura vinacea TaxID=115336 RepID=A0ABP5W2X2_9ACTN
MNGSAAPGPLRRALASLPASVPASVPAPRFRPRRRPDRVTGRWALWLLAAAMLIALAGALPSLTVFTLAIGLVLTVAGAAAVVLLAAGRPAIVRTLPVREAREDEPLPLEFRVRMPSWLPIRLEVRTGPHTWVPLDRDGGTVELFVERRGAHVVGPSPMRLGDPLGILRRPVTAGVPEPVLILPEPGTDARIVPPRGARADDLEPDGLRPYVPGSPISRVHWPSLARGGELQERRIAAPPTGLPLVIVDTSGATDPRAVDWVARAAAGCALSLARSGGCEVLLPGAKAPMAVVDGATWRAVHRRLALLEPGRQGGARRPPGGRGSSVVHVPPGLDLGPERPPLPPGVVPMPTGHDLAFVATIGTASREPEPVR